MCHYKRADMCTRSHVAFTLFVSVILAVQVKGFKECKWVDTNRRIDSAEKIKLNRTDEYCIKKFNAGDSTWFVCFGTFAFKYIKKECLCGGSHFRSQCNNFKCSECFKEKVCMNNGTLLRERCEDEFYECACSEGFSGDLCGDVLEQRKCNRSVSSKESQGLKECSQAGSNELKCFVQKEAKQPFICGEAAKDVQSVKIIQRLPSCFEDDLINQTDKDSPDAWSSWSECDNWDSNQTCLCRVSGVKVQVSNCTVHGQWASWSEWSGCSKTCGRSGKRTRKRRCDNPAPRYGGDICQGNKTESMKCPENPRCPVYYNRHTWSDWQTMETLNDTHVKQSKSRLMCKAGIPLERMVTACYIKSRVRYCKKGTNKCIKADLESLEGKNFPVDWMVGKYCAKHRRSVEKYCKRHKLGMTFPCSQCAKSPLSSKQCFCIEPWCERQNVYIND